VSALSGVGTYSVGGGLEKRPTVKPFVAAVDRMREVRRPTPNRVPYAIGLAQTTHTHAPLPGAAPLSMFLAAAPLCALLPDACG
jgi:hypothetical protein